MASLSPSLCGFVFSTNQTCTEEFLYPNSGAGRNTSSLLKTALHFSDTRLGSPLQEYHCFNGPQEKIIVWSKYKQYRHYHWYKRQVGDIPGTPKLPNLSLRYVISGTHPQLHPASWWCYDRVWPSSFQPHLTHLDQFLPGSLDALCPTQLT